ncbi:DUF6509 family protein [Heyndrickxia oleronia]|uniref:Pullulanase n=1 Tax=Heyndrickxia oleronia TaxID=38875 RepID=A0A8E2LCU7_9BACI|nr:DUF6509 family protein [Heyndrickxia oleronia]MBU5210317.1 pullulanase [Heyndrickxia oleronia]MEC1374287.1 DUF6509 family protein [Heyndrickxia oleronia]OOP66548.1 pullulanase [Heyndrickxia oleronia]QQZ07124.1 pullulanase [Heyndrickxia oleronia]
MEITGHIVEKLNDPTGIIVGDRYEFFLNIEVPEDDELYSENGVLLKVIYAVEDQGSRIALYQFIERATNEVLDFALEDEEEELVNEYCKQHIE